MLWNALFEDCTGSVPDLDPYVIGFRSGSVIYFCTDPNTDPSINKQKNEKNLDSYCFVTSI
jgi:hypothetical protein